MDCRCNSWRMLGSSSWQPAASAVASSGLLWSARWVRKNKAKPKKKVLGERMRKSRAPAGFVPKPLRNCSPINAETLLLEPTKNKEIVPKPCETAATKMPKRCFWNPLKTRQNPRERCLGSACEKAEPQQVLCPSHCETIA